MIDGFAVWRSSRLPGGGFDSRSRGPMPIRGCPSDIGSGGTVPAGTGASPSLGRVSRSERYRLGAYSIRIAQGPCLPEFLVYHASLRDKEDIVVQEVIPVHTIKGSPGVCSLDHYRFFAVSEQVGQRKCALNLHRLIGQAAFSDEAQDI